MPGISKIILLPFGRENHIQKTFHPLPPAHQIFVNGKRFPSTIVYKIFLTWLLNTFVHSKKTLNCRAYTVNCKIHPPPPPGPIPQ